MSKHRKYIAGVAAVVAILAVTGFGAVGAAAYAPAETPVVPAVPSGSCNKSPCILYPKSVQLPSGRMLMAYEESTGPVVGQDLPVYKSDDNGDTWQKLTDIGSPASQSSSAQCAGLTSNWTNPYFYVLPADLGPYKKGTVLLSTVASSGQSGSNDRLASAIVLWASTDSGATWQLISKVAASPMQYSGTQGDTVWQDPVWEPYLMMRDGRLVVFYSDERDVLSVDASTGVVQFDPVPLRRGPEGTGISALPVPPGGNRLAQGGSPVIVSRPDGSIVYNAAGSGSVWVNQSGRSDGVWKEYKTPVSAGYSRNLQYVSATGRIQILQAPWGTGPVSAGQVDLGNSAGTYYTLVNRATGEILSTEADKTQDAIFTGDQPDIITWGDNPANPTQRWHAVQKGNSITFLNKAGGRALGIWQGNASAGTRIAQWVDDGGVDKKWNLVPTSDGYVRIQSAQNTSLYMTAPGPHGAVALQSQLPSSNDDLQEWKLVPSN